MNYYNILGVSENADEKEITSAYRKLSFAHHPDRNKGNEEEATRKFQEISSAYETLKDKQLRQNYDHELKYGPGSSPFFGGGGGGMEAEMHDINNIFNMMFGGGGGFPGGGFPGGAYPGMGDMPAGVHVFQMGPGMMGPGMMGPEHIFQQMQKPPPIIKNIEITLDLAYFGGSYSFDLEKNITKNGIRVIEIETINIDIPQGVNENEVIVLRNRGHVMNEHISGDVKLCITIMENETFKRLGNDLIYKKKLSLKDALCGFALEIRHLNGKILNMNNVTNPTIIKPGYKKVVPNMGMIRNLQTGNLIIEFDIVFPDTLNELQMNSLKQIL
jgi:DnaJ-class molecular chaperone